jgi:hypothetical protein
MAIDSQEASSTRVSNIAAGYIASSGNHPAIIHPAIIRRY